MLTSPANLTFRVFSLYLASMTRAAGAGCICMATTAGQVPEFSFDGSKFDNPRHHTSHKQTCWGRGANVNFGAAQTPLTLELSRCACRNEGESSACAVSLPSWRLGYACCCEHNAELQSVLGTTLCSLAGMGCKASNVAITRRELACSALQGRMFRRLIALTSMVVAMPLLHAARPWESLWSCK